MFVCVREGGSSGINAFIAYLEKLDRCFHLDGLASSLSVGLSTSFWLSWRRYRTYTHGCPLKKAKGGESTE